MRKLIFILLLFAPFLAAAQQKMPYSLVDVEELYEQCNSSREDAVHRILVDYTNKLEIRKKPKECLQFFADLKQVCNRNNNSTIYRRVEIFETGSKLRFENRAAKEGQQAFEALFDQYLAKNDAAAALESLYELGQFLQSKSENLGVLKILFYAEKFAQKNNLQNKISYQGLLHRIGYVLWVLDKPQKSITYFKKSLEASNGLVMDSLIALNGIGINYQKLDSLHQSLHYFNMASQMAERTNNHVFNTVILGSASATLEKLDSLDNAFHYAGIYKNECVKDSLWANAAEGYYRMALIEIKRTNYKNSKIFIDSLEKLLVKVKTTPNDIIVNKRYKEVAYNFYVAVNDYKNALYAHQGFIHYDSLFNDYSNKNTISELELNAAIRMYEQEMAEKEHARKLKDWLKTGITVAALLTIIFLSVWGFKKIKKMQKQKAETEIINQQQAAEIEILKEQLLNQLAAIRTHNAGYEALAAQNLEYAPNKENRNINDTALPATIVAENDICLDNGATPIQLLMAFDLTQKEQWKDFKISFSKTYPEFEQQIVIKVGSVSAAELRLMMLLKLGLNNKQIAETLLITIDGVKKAKYRLYKKIGVSSTEEMSAFLS